MAARIATGKYHLLAVRREGPHAVPTRIVGQPHRVAAGHVSEEQFPVATLDNPHNQKMPPVWRRERGPVRIAGEGAWLYIAIGTDDLH